MSDGKWIIEQPDMVSIELVLGEYAYLKQSDDDVILQPEAALALSDKLAAWAVPRLAKADRP